MEGRRSYVGSHKVEATLNDVNYLIRKTPRSKAIVAHVDKLRKYYGEQPVCFRDLSISASEVCDGRSTARQPVGVPRW